MTERKVISDDEKWQAVFHCDSSYDDVFFYGVKTTGIFCKPSCKSKAPVRGNVAFFEQAAEATKLGYRPCKRCCPDKDFDPELELLNKIKDIIGADYNHPIYVSDISQQLGFSKNHLIRLFKRNYGLTPTQYVTKVRINKAAELLNQEELSILEIAYTVGFTSLSNFYKCFKEHTGLTPNEFRKSREDSL